MPQIHVVYFCINVFIIHVTFPMHATNLHEAVSIISGTGAAVRAATIVA
jgi:hypothetical protein